MMFTFTTKCGRAKRHRLHIDGDGNMTMLDHDEDMARSFAAFGAKKPRCLQIIEYWEDNPVLAVTDRRLFGRPKVLRIIAAWLDRALPYYTSVKPDDERLAKGIDGIRRGLHGTYMTGLANKVQAAARALTQPKDPFMAMGPMKSTPYQAARVAAAVVAGCKMAAQKGPGPKWQPGQMFQQVGSALGLDVANEAAAATVVPTRETVLGHGSAVRRFKVARHVPEAEREWQLRRALEILSEP
jgi:hypothetical protein